MPDIYQFSPIGEIKSCFKEKFGVPRQSGMLSQATGFIKLLPDPRLGLALRHLEGFSHIWVLFIFHKNGENWRPTIEPPRLGGPERVGVFASRSPHRPNPIGLSALKLEKIDFEAKGGIEIHLSGLDLLAGTPVLDIKPYLPFTDSLPLANAGWANEIIPRYAVNFSSDSQATLDEYHSKNPNFSGLLKQMLELDPRPTSQRKAVPLDSPQSHGHKYAFRILDFDVQWHIEAGTIFVDELLSL